MARFTQEALATHVYFFGIFLSSYLFMRTPRRINCFHLFSYARNEFTTTAPNGRDPCVPHLFPTIGQICHPYRPEKLETTCSDHFKGIGRERVNLRPSSQAKFEFVSYAKSCEQVDMSFQGRYKLLLLGNFNARKEMQEVHLLPIK